MLRITLRFQRVRPALPHESFLRRRISRLRSTRNPAIRSNARKTRRSDDLHISASHKMYLSQIRTDWFDANARFALHITIKYRQRKNLHINMVLVHRVGRYTIVTRRVSHMLVRVPVPQAPLVANFAQNRVAPRRRRRYQPSGHGRLVAAVHAG